MVSHLLMGHSFNSGLFAGSLTANWCTVARWKKWVRRDDEAALTLLQPREVVERMNLLRAVAEIEQQNMPALNGPLDAWDQHNAARGRVGFRQPIVVQKTVLAELANHAIDVFSPFGAPLQFCPEFGYGMRPRTERFQRIRPKLFGV